MQLDFPDFCAVIFEDSDRPEKLLQLPPSNYQTSPTTPPPSISVGKTAPTTPPPVELPNFTDYPLPNRSEKLLQLPPVELPNFTDYPHSPPSKSAGKTAPTTPLELPNFVQLEKILRITPGLLRIYLRRFPFRSLRLNSSIYVIHNVYRSYILYLFPKLIPVFHFLQVSFGSFLQPSRPAKSKVGARHCELVKSVHMVDDMVYIRGPQSAARGPHAALEQAQCGPRQNFGKNKIALIFD